jgi:putative transposase
VKYAWIREHRDSYPVALMCEVLEVSKSGYYDSLDRQPSERARRHARIQAAVREVHARSRGIYGSYKIAQQMKQSEHLERACRNTVAQAMQELGLKSKVSKGFTPTTTKADPTRQPAPNTLDRDFTAEAPNRKWVTDISVPQKRHERWESGLPQSACRSRLQTTMSGCG